MSDHRATVFYTPRSESELVIIKARWAADCNGETAAFATQEEAIDFAWKRWRVPREDVRIVGPESARGETGRL